MLKNRKKQEMFAKISIVILTLGILLLSFGLAKAQTGPNSPSSETSNGAGDNLWNLLGRTYVSDNSKQSSTTLMSNGQTTDNLVVYGFGFSIPATDIIDGIVVEVEKRVSSGGTGGNIRDSEAYLTKDASTSVGTDESVGGNWPASDTYVSYGGTGYLWGTTWTAAEINSGNFGFIIKAIKSGGGTRRPRIDHIRITVYHSSPLPITL